MHIGDDGPRHLILLIIVLTGLYTLFYFSTNSERVRRTEISESCKLMDPINLKLGEVVFSYPAKLDAYVYEDKAQAKYPRRIIKGVGSYQICDEDQPYHYASGVSIKALSVNNWANRWAENSWIPLGVFTGISKGKSTSFLRAEKGTHTSKTDSEGNTSEFFIKKTGYKSDISQCHIRTETNYEGCWLNRYLENLDISISAHIAVTNVNLYGKPVKPGEQQTREQWPEYMDRLELFWRSMVLEN